MTGTAEAPSFQIESQSAAAISNVGGDQNVYFDGKRSRVAVVARAVAAIGLASLFAGLGLLVVTIVQTTQKVLDDVHHLSAPYTHYVGGMWLPTVVLLSVGLVLTKFGRLLASR
jgi:hypothetical protein